MLGTPGAALAEGTVSSPASTLAAHKSDKLGPPPEPCFPLGSSHSVCPENGFENPAPPDFMAATYYGQIHISPHLVAVGQDITASAATADGGEPSWATPPGPIVSGCKNAMTVGGSTTPADTTCTWKATQASEFPPSEAVSGWRGGWEVWESGFCGFFGCAPSGDYYYVNSVKHSGHSHHKPHGRHRHHKKPGSGHQKPLKCKKGFKKQKVNGKLRCVKLKISHHRQHYRGAKHSPSASARR